VGEHDPAAPKAPDEPDAKRGLAALVRVNLPLTAGADGSLKQSITRARDRLVQAAREAGDSRRPTLVLEIAPTAASDNGGAGSDFEPAFSLARVITEDLADVKTVAWLPRSIRGHGVLVAIACEEIVMPSDAEVGEAGADEPAEQGGPSDTVIEAYRETARMSRSRRMPEAIAESMINPAAELVQIESDEGTRFLLRDEVDDFRRDHEVINERVLVDAGQLGHFTGREGRQMGFVAYQAADNAALARALAIPVESLNEEQALLADWQAIAIDVRGEITPRTASQFKTLLTNNITGGANWVAVRIDSVGGDLAACLDMASTLAALDPNDVRTVAYVPVEARGGAAIIALACDQLVMHADAKLGLGPQASNAGEPQLADPREAQDNRELPPQQQPGLRRPAPPEAPPREAVDVANAVTTIRDWLAPRTERSWSLLAAMVDPAVEVASYRNKASGEERIMSAEEAAALPDAANWNRGAAVAANNQPLEISGEQAVRLDVAWRTVASFDELQRQFGIADLRTVEPNWALTLVQALASPGLGMFLVFLGFVGIYIELKTPGVGVGGVVAAVAFLLFFWAQYLGGTAGSLEILMFVSGIVLMLLEVFVVPGVGIFGLAGGLLVLFSLVLATQTFVLPHSKAELEQLTTSIAMIVTAGLGMVVLAIATRRYLPRAPVFNRLVLEPPPPEERVTLSHREALADYSHLVGKTGEAVTDLLPAGKALVEDELVDVIAQGEPVDRGQPVVVVSAHANRVVVRRTS
jgi:membrane-bound serine protease (ClpP class)